MDRRAWITGTGILLLLSGCNLEDAVAPRVTGDPVPQLGLDLGGSPLELRPLPGDAAVGVYDLNASGTVVGTSGSRPVIWTDGEPTLLDTLPGYGATSRPRYINEAGLIAGTAGNGRPVLWGDDGKMVDLGTLPGYDFAGVNDLGEGGDVVGVARTSANGPNGERGVLWFEGEITELPPLPGHDISYATEVDPSGLVIGVSYTWGIEDYRFVAWRDGQVLDARGPGLDSHVLVELTNAGDAYYTPANAGDDLIVWRAGESTVVYPAGLEPYRTFDDVTPEGRVLGSQRTSPLTWQQGLIQEDGTFLPFLDDVATNCLAISDGGHALCEGPGFEYPFLISVDRLLGPPPGTQAYEVTDLRIGHASDTWIRLRWTEVDDGTGAPADYRAKYAAPPLTDWKNATIGCDRWIRGEIVGGDMLCTVEGLEPATEYDFQLMSYRVEDGRWAGARYSNTVGATTLPRRTESVTDLMVTSVTEQSLTLAWTQVDDGAGEPALYRVRYGPSPMVPWRSGTIGCDPTFRGDAIGAEIGCTIRGLEPGVTYDAMLMSFRLEDGAWVNARYSNRATATTATSGS